MAMTLPLEGPGRPAPTPAPAGRRGRFLLVLAAVVGFMVVVAFMARPSALDQCDRLLALAQSADRDPALRCGLYLEQRRAIRSQFRYRHVFQAEARLAVADDIIVEVLLRPTRYRDLIAAWCPAYASFVVGNVQHDQMRRWTQELGRQLRKERFRAAWVEKLVRDNLDLVIDYTRRQFQAHLSETNAARIQLVRSGNDFVVRA